jgi:hypothetical protein
LDITNGHAARMRFSRFKQHMDGVSPTARRARIDSHQRKKIKHEKRLKEEEVKKEAIGEDESIKREAIGGDKSIKKEAIGGDEGIETQHVKREPDIKTEPMDGEQANETLVYQGPCGAYRVWCSNRGMGPCESRGSAGQL